MPNIKSVMKNDVKSKLQNAKNRAEKTAMKTSLKKFDAAINAGDKDAAAATFKAAVQSVEGSAPEVRDGQEAERSGLIKLIQGHGLDHALLSFISK